MCQYVHSHILLIVEIEYVSKIVHIYMLILLSTHLPVWLLALLAHLLTKYHLLVLLIALATTSNIYNKINVYIFAPLPISLTHLLILVCCLLIAHHHIHMLILLLTYVRSHVLICNLLTYPQLLAWVDHVCIFAQLPFSLTHSHINVSYHARLATFQTLTITRVVKLAHKTN